jgi:hypothetical protein
VAELGSMVLEGFEMKVENERTDSPIRRCREHECYFVEGNGPHAKHDSFALQWGEVTYYLEKLRTIRETFNKLRQELSI